MGASKRKKLLAIIATDRTFERVEARGEAVWAGKCIHCNRKLVVTLDGDPVNRVTIEHIVPRNHGGTDELDNLALACAGCNQEKGVRHDHKRNDDPRLRAVIDTLQARRRERWREP